MKKTIDPQVIRQRLESAFFMLDIPAEVERHTGTRLHPVSRTGKQYGGACPYDDCSADNDGFMVWRDLTAKGCHFHCRVCRRAGDIVKLVMDIKGLKFGPACVELGIPNPYLDDEEGMARPVVRRSMPKAEPWQLDELKCLSALYGRAQLALQRDRARAYLSERGIPFDLAADEGLGYIPATNEVSGNIPAALRRWCDRIIFPVLTPHGEVGYCGRSLFLWQLGMDEDEHKAKLDAHNQQMREQHGDKAGKYLVHRWLFTYQNAYYNWQAASDFDTLAFVEGPFDVLACKASGVQNALAIGTKGIDVRLLPVNVCAVVMGLDIDGPGRSAAKGLATGLRRKGIDVSICTPTGGKDWSAAYRLQGIQGLASLAEALANRLVCERCGIGNSPSSEAFQIQEGKTLCCHCVVASMPPVPPDEALAKPFAVPVVSLIEEGTKVITPLGRATVSRIYDCRILDKLRAAVILDLWQKDGTKFRVFDMEQIRPVQKAEK